MEYNYMHKSFIFSHSFVVFVFMKKKSYKSGGKYQKKQTKMPPNQVFSSLLSGNPFPIFSYSDPNTIAR